MPGAGGQDGPHVGGAPPAERDRPVQRGQERLLAVGGAQRVQLGQLAGPAGCCPAAAAPVMNASATGPERAELLLRRGLRPHRPPRRGPRAAVVLIADRRLARRDQDMLGDDLPGGRS